MRVLVVGASGLVGSRLVPALQEAGHSVVATSRDPSRHSWPEGVETVRWDGAGHLEVPGRVDAVVNLAGEPVAARRWNATRKARLAQSRVELTRHLAGWINGRPARERPKVLVNAGAVGYYGLRPKGPISESSPAGTDFLATLCQAWEQAASTASTRVVGLRIGHVLDSKGGLLGNLLPYARLGLAGPIGSGRQAWPWVHHEDVTGIIEWALVSPHARGYYNATAPRPVANREFMRVLGRVLRRPAFLPVPVAALRLRFGELGGVLAGGQDARPARLLEEGYAFRHTGLEEALRGLLGR